MVCLDSDIIGILLALLTVVVPAIVKAFDNRKKKDNDASNGQDPDKKEELEALFDEFLGKETSKSGVEEVSHHIVMYKEEHPVEQFAEHSRKDDCTERYRTQKSQFKEPLVRKIDAEELRSRRVMEGKPQTQSQTCTEDSEKSSATFKERFKDNPKDAVLFAQILNPKFKEY